MIKITTTMMGTTMVNTQRIQGYTFRPLPVLASFTNFFQPQP